MFVPNFKILGQVVHEKSLTKISIFIPWSERLKKEKIEKEGKKESQHLGFVFSNYLIVLMLHTKFKDSGSNRS